MKTIFILLWSMLAGVSAFAVPLWMRYPVISPDGKEIAFAYKGDIYKVSSAGGLAKRLTSHPAYDFAPVWSPDSRQIAFASARNGNFDVFLMPAEGGEPKRLTTYSGKEIPYAFTPDGKYIVYAAQIQDPAQSALFPKAFLTELYKVSLKGGRPEQLLATAAENVNFARSGESFVYENVKGSENAWRKHHTSSVTRDIILYDMKSGKHTFLVQRAGEDRNPVFAPGDKEIYFLSERDGSFNVYTLPLAHPEEVKQLTFFKKNPVRFLSVSGDGTLCFGYEGEIYLKKGAAQPEKVKIEIIGESNIEDVEYLSYTKGASEAVPSPDGKQVAFTLRGEVFVTSVDYPTTKQITHTPESETDLSFAPDNRTLAYASERDGNWNIFLAHIVREEDPNFSNATLVREEALFKPSATERFAPSFSPDGKELAYIEDRERLMVIDLKTRKIRQITDGKKQYNSNGHFDYSWSPDGKWFALEYNGNKHEPYSDIAIVSAEGGEIVNLTQSGYTDRAPRWVLNGNAVLFISERYGMRNHASWGSLNDVMLVFLNQEAYDRYKMSPEDYEWAYPKKDKGEKPEEKPEKITAIKVELDNIEDRIVRLTPNSAALGGAIVDKKGEKLYYLAAFEDGYDLWETDMRKKETKLLHKLNGGWANLEWDTDGENLFLLGRNKMIMVKTGYGKMQNITYVAEMKLDKAEERNYMFDRVYRQELKRFYDKGMHGVDWPALRKTYEKFLPYINNNYDFSELLSELLGELNVSHTGGRYRPAVSGEATAELGLFFRWNDQTDGLYIEEVVEKGPFDKEASQVKAGDIVEKIDGVVLTRGMDYFPLLNRKAGKKVLVSLYRPGEKKHWEEVVIPVSQSAWNHLLYKRWVKQRAAEVDRLSGGRLGYVHIESMGDPSFRSVYSDILGKYNEREGIVIDTRFNGGGRLHEDIEVLFSGEKYFTQVVRGKEACDMPSRRWNKPSVMLIGEANYSNAHGTPWVYKHKGLGKLVGMPVPGTMTSVSWETLQDPSLVFGIPIVGYRLADGSYLENQQLEPDVKMMNRPEEVVKGRDEQLEKAVQVLLEELDGKK
ncbi:S41 family peptidase [uncultured Odoribacter sp.]|uniref:S41 family peptidase n=1 Tax=uncultured Odoribacter sp. TaxID=876416 RepID=UPI00260F2DAF|nr:S41 family peptidase [uncultured Odoribacter sp.]